MTLILQQIFGFFRLLNSETGHNQIAAGVALGLVLGLSPTLSLQTLLVFLLIFLFRIQAGAAILSAFFFKFAGYLLDPVVDPLGRWVLEQQNLRPLFIELYNMPIVPFTRFNNSIVMGSGVLALALAPFSFALITRLPTQSIKVVAPGFNPAKLTVVLTKKVSAPVVRSRSIL
jgi:uncharacterized protein (TIGR03546 family)